MRHPGITQSRYKISLICIDPRFVTALHSHIHKQIAQYTTVIYRHISLETPLPDVHLGLHRLFNRTHRGLQGLSGGFRDFRELSRDSRSFLGTSEASQGSPGAHKGCRGLWGGVLGGLQAV